MDEISGGLKVILIFSAIIVGVGLLGLIAAYYWPITLLLAIALIGGGIYWKFQTRAKNRV